MITMVGIAQLAEHWIVVPGVAGSSPVIHPLQGKPEDAPSTARLRFAVWAASSVGRASDF